jgi:hypothetical protein
VLLQAPKASQQRLLARLRAKHSATPVFEEQCARSDTGILVFRSADPEQLNASILRDAPLCLALARAPFIAKQWTDRREDLTAAFAETCAQAHASGETVKLSAPGTIRRVLLDAVLSVASAQCLTTSSETRTFVVAAAKAGDHFFYATAGRVDERADALAHGWPSRPLFPMGHWHPTAAAADRHGGDASICKAFAKLSSLFCEEPTFEAALAAAAARPEPADRTVADDPAATTVVPDEPAVRTVAGDTAGSSAADGAAGSSAAGGSCSCAIDSTPHNGPNP